MALVIKGNKQLTVAAEKVNEYLSIGYSEIDEDGKVLQVGEPYQPHISLPPLS